MNNETAARVAKLIPMLSSDQMGEVAAAASAIGRALNGGGCDWHDLAKRVSDAPTFRNHHNDNAKAHNYSSGIPKWRDFKAATAVKHLANIDHRWLNGWEQEFVSSILDQSELYQGDFYPSPKQEIALNRIFNLAHARGYKF